MIGLGMASVVGISVAIYYLCRPKKKHANPDTLALNEERLEARGKNSKPPPPVLVTFGGC